MQNFALFFPLFKEKIHTDKRKSVVMRMSFAYKYLWTEAHFTGILEKFRTKKGEPAERRDGKVIGLKLWQCSQGSSIVAGHIS